MTANGKLFGTGNAAGRGILACGIGLCFGIAGISGIAASAGLGTSGFGIADLGSGGLGMDGTDIGRGTGSYATLATLGRILGAGGVGSFMASITPVAGWPIA